MMPSIFGENLFDDWMNFSFPDIDNALYGKHEKNMMKTDVKDMENHYEIAVDSGSMSRSFYVGSRITEPDIHAKYENGILTLNIPKEDEKAIEKKRFIEIEG